MDGVQTSTRPPQDVDEFCEEVGVPVPTLYKFRHSEYFPLHFRNGRRVKIIESAPEWRTRIGGALPSIKRGQSRLGGKAA